MHAYLLTGAAGLITLAGGLVALRAEASRGFVFAFCAGALIATALVSVVPESLELLAMEGRPEAVREVLLACLAGFFLFYFLENLGHHDEPDHPAILHHTHRHQTGVWGAFGIGVHSFLDGLAIGVGFDAGERLGWSVAVGVLLHKLADGVSVAGVMSGTRHDRRATLAMVALASVAPLAGVLAHRVVALPLGALALVFGWFGGVFLYLGATSLLPAAHEAAGSRSVQVAALAGVALVCTAAWLGV
jgi:zinc transporter, ZIP family